MPRTILLCLVLLVACAPVLQAPEQAQTETPPMESAVLLDDVPLNTLDYFAANGITPERQVTLAGRVGERGFIGQSEDELTAAGAQAIGSFETPPSTLYQYPGSDNYYFVCDATAAVFQIKLVYTDNQNYNLLTPFGVGMLSFASELRAVGLTETADAENLYFSYGYDSAGQLTEPVGFYFTFNVVASAVTALDVIGSCS